MSTERAVGPSEGNGNSLCCQVNPVAQVDLGRDAETEGLDGEAVDLAVAARRGDKGGPAHVGRVVPVLVADEGAEASFGRSERQPAAVDLGITDGPALDGRSGR